jgi:hypothetical protein
MLAEHTEEIAMQLYIVTIQLTDGRNLIQGVYGRQARAESEAERLRSAEIEYLAILVTQTQLID